jgi:peptide/nickel transport system ATP-binding protein
VDVIVGGDRGLGSRTAALIAVDDLYASYGQRAKSHRAVNGVSLDIEPGECVALVGQSGSGKTTIGRCIAGLHRPDSGQVLLRDSPLPAIARERTREQRRAIQIVFQNPDRSLNPRRTVADAIARPLRMFDRPASSAEEAAALESLLERVRLPARFLRRYPPELSGGERQRVAIARALAAKPSLLLCDEITSSLDVSIQAAIVSLLESLRADGLGLLFITHNLALVNSIADRVIVLNNGEICESGGTDEVIRRPRAQYTQELLAAAPELSPSTRTTRTHTLAAAPNGDGFVPTQPELLSGGDDRGD